MELLFSIIAFTAILAGFFGGLLVYSALVHGGEFYVNDFYGRRKKWIEKLLDGLEVLGSL